MSISRVILTGGQFQDSEGNVLANGYLTMRLSADEEVNDSLICSGIVIRIQLDMNGNVVASPSQAVWGNDQMLPVNSYYIVTGYTVEGQLAFGPNNQQVLGNGGYFDVGTWIPNYIVSWTPPLQPLLVEVNGTPDSSQNILNFVNSATVTFSNPSGGNVTATATAAPPTIPPSLPQPDVGNFALWQAQNGAGGFTTAFECIGDAVNFTGSCIRTTVTATMPAAVHIQNGQVNGQNGGQYFWPARVTTIKTAIASLATNASGYCYAGLSNAITGTAVENPVTGSYDSILAGYSQSSGTSLGNWLMVINIGGSETTYDSGVAVVANTMAYLEIRITSGVATLYVNGTATSATTSNLPTSNPLAIVLYQTSPIDSLMAYIYAQTSTP